MKNKQNFDPTVPCYRVIRSDGRLGQCNRRYDNKIILRKK